MYREVLPLVGGGYKLFVDGTSKSNLGKTNLGGVTIDELGIIMVIAWAV